MFKKFLITLLLITIIPLDSNDLKDKIIKKYSLNPREIPKGIWEFNFENINNLYFKFQRENNLLFLLYDNGLEEVIYDRVSNVCDHKKNCFIITENYQIILAYSLISLVELKVLYFAYPDYKNNRVYEISFDEFYSNSYKRNKNIIHNIIFNFTKKKKRSTEIIKTNNTQ